MGPWAISILSSVPSAHHSAFNKAYNWPQRIFYNKESDCIRAVVNGDKAVATADSQVRFNIVGNIPSGFDIIAGIPSNLSEIFYNKANEDIARLLEWVITNLDPKDAEFHYMSGIIFGIPFQNIRDFIDQSNYYNKSEALQELDSLINTP
jgi:hypothetical protein